MFKTAPQRRWWLGSLSAVILALSACGEDSLEKEKRASAQKYYRSTNSIMAPNEALVEFESVAHNGAEVLSNATRNPYFGAYMSTPHCRLTPLPLVRQPLHAMPTGMHKESP